MIQEYLRPSSVEEALDIQAKKPGSRFLAGGTFLLAGDRREKPACVVDLGAVLPAGIERKASVLSIGAGATFQDLADSEAMPSIFKAAALSMVNRNVRAKATAGGNLAAGKSCATLVPLALAFGAKLLVAFQDGSSTRRETMAAEAWLDHPKGIILGLDFDLSATSRAAYGRYARTACDLSVLTVAVACRGESGKLQDLRIAMGGLGPRARRLPAVEALFEGQALPSKADIEASALPHFSPRSDWRGSAEFKKARAACLLADALHNAEKVL
jgi:probable selenate reductase FAD-binding subunit